MSSKSGVGSEETTDEDTTEEATQPSVSTSSNYTANANISRIGNITNMSKQSNSNIARSLLKNPSNQQTNICRSKSSNSRDKSTLLMPNMHSKRKTQSLRQPDTASEGADEIVVETNKYTCTSSFAIQPLSANEISSLNNVPLAVQKNENIPYNWQSTNRCIKDRLKFICQNELLADIYFVVGRPGHTQRIPAHKLILSIGSAVFDAMFNGGIAQTSNEIELPDIEPKAFLCLLRYLYTDQVDIDSENVMVVLYTAKKYAVPALEEKCVEFLKEHLTSDNAFMLLTQARLFDEQQLTLLCLQMIDKNTTEALNSEGFVDVDIDTMKAVLARDTLGVREIKLWDALLKWTESECRRKEFTIDSQNKRLVLNDLLHLIRFPLMTVEEFAIGPAQSSILTDREIVDLFLYFTLNNSTKPNIKFSDVPRCCLTGNEQVINRFAQIESRWGYSGTSDRIRFTVNKRIFIVGFGLYGSIHGSCEYSSIIQIIQTDIGKVMGTNETTFQCDGSPSTFRVMFKEPIEIQPGISYTASCTLKGPDSFYGTKGIRKVAFDSNSIGRINFQFNYAAGNNNGTSVEDGQLPEIIFFT